MAIYTANLSTQSTNVHVCNIDQPRHGESWFATAATSGAIGGGTVTWNISFDDGVTLLPMTQDGTATAATQTAVGAINLRSGHINRIKTASGATQPQPKIYASIGAATNPTLTLTILDNR